MNVNYNNNGMGENDLIDFMKSAKKYQYYPSAPHFTTEQTVAGANMHIKLIRSALTSQTGMQQYRYFDYSVKLTANDGSRACFVRFPAKVGNDAEWTDKTYYLNLLVTTNTNNPITCVKPSTINGIRSYQYESSSSESATTMTEESYDLEVFGSSWGYLNTNNIQFGVDDVSEKMNALKTAYGNFKVQRYTNGTTGVINVYCLPNQVGKGNTQVFSYQSFAFPVFDYDNTDGIKNYLTNGDDSGSVDPFDPNNPKIVKVTDFKTNFKICLSPYNKTTGIKATVIAYNQQYIDGGDVVAGTCELAVKYSCDGGATSTEAGKSSINKYPTVSYNFNIGTGSGDTYNMYCQFVGITDTGESSKFSVSLGYKENSETHCKVLLVGRTPVWRSAERTNIVDGYRYTLSDTGEYVDVVFRSATLDDLENPYDDEDDTENPEHGSDTDTGVAGKGLRTYAISDTQFEGINNALWSTDWTTVFKSNTINPVNCIMACKSIPFTASALSSGSITIANLDTNVTANYVTPIKTISCGSVTLDKYHKDFTDLTLTKVRVFLPYIGWRELPASEVIGRDAVPKCGLVAHNKILAFKYIVDFVDGNCRCVISVNGTERYYFDGNCSIDVPVTSDNHTTAVGNAIKAGVQTVMSIGAGVASGFAGNAIGAVGGAISALQSLPNVIPSYQYTATTSPSGYIDASMPQKIIILIERPVYTVPDNYAHSTGRPCGLTLTLGSLSGFTKCANVDISGVSGTDRQRSEVKQLLESGIYL